MSKSHAQFCLAQALRFRIHSDGGLYASLSHSSGEFYVAPEVLGILCEIAKDQREFHVQKLLQNLHAGYSQTLKNLPSPQECQEIVEDLCAAGLLIKQGAKAQHTLLQDGFGDAWIQWAMLADTPRCEAYEKAITQCIDDKSIVVDVGAGSGLLSAICLEAQAKKVVAIEETHMAKNIKPLLSSLGLPKSNSQLEILNKNSFDAVLPRDTTHVVSELFGNDPFSEGVIPTLRNISERLLKQPTYIPLSVEVYFEVVDILEHPIKHRIQSVLISGQKDKINASLSQKFLTAAHNKFNFEGISFPVALNAKDFLRVSAPILLGSLPLNPPQSYVNLKKHPLCGEKKIKITKENQCPVGLMWFKVNLTSTVTLSSHPHEKDRCEHWSPVLVLLQKNLALGEYVNISHSLNELETAMECEVYVNKIKIGGRG